MTFLDHFSSVAQAYREFRPTYPSELFAFLASIVDRHKLAWDCATGNGQAAVDLSVYFDDIIATDASQEQIAQAEPHPKVEYRVALAEQSGLDDQSVDLITVAQALHWFRLDPFYREVRRVLRPGGVIAVFGYALMSCEHADVNKALQHFYWETLVKGNYWPPERCHLDDAYQNLDFPFEKIETPQFYMKTDWNLNELINYLGTWSAVKEYKRREDVDPIEKIRFPNLDRQRKMAFVTPLILKCGKL